ncbi:regucalcin-like [Toxorhynchites rutilus septentrionalis]|uniref:regucalcin-like n=1 Tax=Toxorhynchites rutilus septentrionalis TaxID=329112 RepID=UPI0024785D62|nr:regucalcin-like [Toxorhynchites rutilus septentrionalis]
MTTNYKVEEIPGPQLDLGEGPHWDIKRQSLYYVSLLEATIHRFDYNKKRVFSAKVEGCSFASFIVPVKGGRDEFVIGDGHRLVLITWDGTSTKARLIKIIAQLGTEERDQRWNDGKVDSRGRLFAGTMIDESKGNPFEVNVGNFYRYDAGKGGLVRQFNDVFISNGIAWNDQTKKIYYADSGAYDIKEFDVDDNGNLNNGKVWYDFKEKGRKPIHFPDGMTIDAEGNLYVAIFYGAKVLKINSRGEIDTEINVPAKQVTSVAFGGPRLDELYVTTAKRQFTDPTTGSAGATFKVTNLGVTGTPMNELVL